MKIAWKGTIGSKGCIIPVRVGVTPEQAKILTNAGKPVPDPIPVNALIDTGASRTVVLAGFLPEEVFGVPAIGGHGLDFLGQQHQMKHRRVIIHVEQLAINIEIAEWPLNQQQAEQQQIIIGRDILRNGILVYDGPADDWRFVIYQF